MHILRFADATGARGQADATGAHGRLGGVDGQIRSGRYREREGEAWQGKREKEWPCFGLYSRVPKMCFLGSA